MKTTIEVNEGTQEVVEQSAEPQAQTTGTVDPKEGTLLQNRYDTYYLTNGYELKDGFKTRNREEAKDEAKRLRAEEGQLAVYVTLSGGWFGVFHKDAPEKEAKAAKSTEPKEEVHFSFTDGKVNFEGSTKEARAFARLLVEAARNAEYNHDRQKALAKKAAGSIEEPTD